MRAAGANYARYLIGPYARALGRFVVPVDRFAEFEAAFSSVRTIEPWGLSALVGPDHEADLAAIEKFNERNGPQVHIDTVEVKTRDLNEVSQVRAFVRGTIPPYFEFPPVDAGELVQSVHHIRGRSKIRTGGTTADAFPSSACGGQLL